MGKIWRVIKLKDYLLLLLGLLTCAFNGVIVAEILKEAGQFSPQSSVLTVGRFVGLSLLGWLLIYAGNYLAAVKYADIQRQINLFIKQALVKAALNDPQKATSQTISQITNDLELLDNNYFSAVVEFIMNIGTVIISATFMLLINPLIAMIYISLSFLMVIPERIYQHKLTASGTNFTMQKASYLDFLKDFLTGQATLRWNQAITVNLQQLQHRSETAEAAQFQVTAVTERLKLLSYLISGFNFIAPFGIGLLIIIRTQAITIPALIAIFMASNQVFSPLVAAINCHNKIMTTKTIRTKVLADLTSSNHSALSLVSIRPNQLQQIKLQKITKYDKHRVIFENLNFQVNVGDRILITGKSGVGKSSIFRLLLGQLQPDHGAIEVKIGDKTRQLTEQDQALFGVIQQRPMIFNQDIRYNLTLGQPFTDLALTQVLTKVQLLSELGPEPLAYLVGENGQNLSGGQIARLEIARSLLRAKPILLADEITAALDAKTAAQVRTILYQSATTVIEIAHHYDLQGSQKHFRWLVLEKGQLKPGASANVG